MPTELPDDYDAFKAEVLSDQEADDQGVYEVWWFANSRYPDLALSTRLAIAEAVVRDLLCEGRVTLVRRAWATPDDEQSPVTDTETALLSWSTWVLPPKQPVVWMVNA
jgi:hypothetical protein